MRTEDIEYRGGGVRLVGQYVVDDRSSARRAGVLVCHEGNGLTDHTKKIAAPLAGLGYAAFAWTITAMPGQCPTSRPCGRSWSPG